MVLFKKDSHTFVSFFCDAEVFIAAYDRIASDLAFDFVIREI